MFRILPPLYCRKSTIAITLISTISASAATATTMHRLSTTPAAPATGAEGAFTYNNTSASGSALEGSVASTANTSIAIPFGVLGDYDASSSTFGIGVAGVSLSGYGVGAEVLGPAPAILGLNESSGDGADLFAKGAGVGLQVSSSSGDGAEISASGSNNGIFSIVDGTGTAVYGVSDDGSAGYFTSDTNQAGTAFIGMPTGEGVVAEGGNGNGGHPALEARGDFSPSDIIDAVNGDSAVAFSISNSTANRSQAAAGGGTDVQTSADLYVKGKVYQNCTNFPITTTTTCDDVSAASSATTSSVTRSASGHEVQTYGGRQSQPTVEDFGTARLVQGNAFVPLDPAFVNTISHNKAYLVFITPDGDANGLYVSSKSLQGFVVKESRSGRSTLDFDYRIVASPIDDTSPRFLTLAPKKKTFLTPNLTIQKVYAEMDAKREELKSFAEVRMKRLSALPAFIRLKQKIGN